MANKTQVPRKLVTLGDGGCGKTSLLTVFTKGYFPTTYEPTVFENYVELLKVNDQPVELSLWDTAGQEDFDRLRSLCYAETDVILMCFSVDLPASLENVESKWVSEARTNCPGVEIVLVALKCDLRDDPTLGEKLAERGSTILTYEDGLELARRIKARRYIECSAKLNRGVQEAIYVAAEVALGSRSNSGKLFATSLRTKCTIL